jgi:hypothetical protein
MLPYIPDDDAYAAAPQEIYRFHSGKFSCN